MINIDAKYQQNATNKTQQHIKRIIYYNQLKFTPGVQKSYHMQINKCDTCINGMKDESHMIISIDAGK